MGWTYFHKPRGVSAVEAIKGQFSQEWWDKKVVASSATRQAVFLVIRSHDPESKVYVPDADGMVRPILVFAIRSAPKSEYNFGYKDMDETMGPAAGFEAPLSIIAQASELQPLPENAPNGSHAWAHGYRERSRQAAAARASKRALKAGATVTLTRPLNFGGRQHQTFTVVKAKVRGRDAKQSTVFAAPDGMLCNIRASDLVGATVN